MCLVVSQLKVACVEVLLQLFETGHPTLALFAAALYRPVAALMNKPETRKVPHLLGAVLQCVGAATRCFPNVVADSLNGGATAVLQLLQSEMSALTAVRSLVSVGDKKGGAETSSPSQQLPADLILSVFHTCELVALHCAATLSAAIRCALEEAVGQGLLCLSRGLLPAQYTDRKMHRAPCELLRQNSDIQNALLRLALVEVLLPARGGAGSSNVTLLRRACEACARQPETATEAVRTLLSVGALIHPVSVGLPATSAADVARGHLAGAQSLGASSVAAAAPSSSVSLSSMHAPREIAVVAPEEPKGVKRKADLIVPVEPASNDAKKPKSVADQTSRPNTLPARFQSKPVIASKADKDEVTEDDSDTDSLPDIE